MDNAHRPSTRVARRLVTGIAVSVLIFAGASCSDDAATDEPPTTAGPTTAAPTTASTFVPLTTAGDDVIPDSGGALPLDPLPTSPDDSTPAGDGCTPDSDDDALPDGTWFGTLRSAGPGTSTFALDVACFSTGEAANQAALADDPGAEVPVPNDYYIADADGDATFALIDDGTATVYLLAGDGAELGSPIIGLDAAAAAIDGFARDVVVWVVVQGGQTSLVQQLYLP